MTLTPVAIAYKSNCRDIKAMAALQTEQVDDDTRCVIFIQVEEDGELLIFGWGDTNIDHSFVTLERAKQQLLDTYG